MYRFSRAGNTNGSGADFYLLLSYQTATADTFFY